MQHTGSECLPEVRERSAMARVDELTLHLRYTEATPPEPGCFELARRLNCGAFFALDLFQDLEDVRVRAEAGQHFHKCTEPAARRVENPVDPLRIIPAVAEGPVASDVRPIWEGPGVRAAADAIQRAVGRDCVEPGTSGVARLSHR